MSYTDKVVYWYCNSEKRYLENHKLGPCEVFYKTVNVMSCEVKAEVLNKTKWDCPQQMEQKFFTFFSLCEYLILFHKVKHG